MSGNNIQTLEYKRQLIQLCKAEAVMLKMTRKRHNGLCTADALDKADFDYFEAREKMVDSVHIFL